MIDDPREVVRRGYDANGYEGGGRPFLHHVPAGRIVDLGCGRGEVAAELVARGDEVIGVDISTVQVERARVRVPGATFVVGDMATWDAEPGSLDGVLALWSAIHLPRDDQRHLWTRVGRWLRPGGTLVAVVGTDDWTGTDDFHGAPMFWDHPALEVTLGWLADAGMVVGHTEPVPEAHTLVVATASPA